MRRTFSRTEISDDERRERHRLQEAARKAKDPDKTREARRRSYWKNRDKYLAVAAEERAKNPRPPRRKFTDEERKQRAKEVVRRSRLKKPDVYRAKRMRRRTRKHALPYQWTEQDSIRCREFWDNRCAVCGSLDYLQFDHWIPITSPDCPGTVPSNMVLLCRSCNGSKGNANGIQWLLKKMGETATETIRRIEEYLQKDPTL